MDTKNIKYPIIGTGYKTLSKIKDGNMALGLNLSNDTHIVPCFIDENNIEQSNYHGAETYVSLQLGNRTINPTEISYEIVKSFVEGEWNPAIGKFTVTQLIDDNGYVDFIAKYKEESYTARFSISKVYNGGDSYIFDIGDNNHVFSADSSGAISQDIIVDIDILVYKGISRIKPDRISVPENQPGMTLTIKDNLVQMKALKGSSLAIAGWFDIEVSIHGKTLTKEFRWIKVRDGEKGDVGPVGPVGPTGPQGPTGYVPSWVIDWTNGQTVVNDKLILAGSMFAGEGGNIATGVALGKNVFSDGSNGLCVMDRGDEVFSIFTKPREVNGHYNTMVKIGKYDPVTIDWSGNVRIPGATIVDLRVDQISAAQEGTPLLKLFPNRNGGYCSLDATYAYESGIGNAIRLKWDSNSYYYVSSDSAKICLNGSFLYDFPSNGQMTINGYRAYHKGFPPHSSEISGHSHSLGSDVGINYNYQMTVGSIYTGNGSGKYVYGGGYLNVTDTGGVSGYSGSFRSWCYAPSWTNGSTKLMKENIRYLEEGNCEVKTISTGVSRSDYYNLVKDLKFATFNYNASAVDPQRHYGEEVESKTSCGIILEDLETMNNPAKDSIYVPPNISREEYEEKSLQSYLEIKNGDTRDLEEELIDKFYYPRMDTISYIGSLGIALQVAIEKIEALEKKVEELSKSNI